MNLNRIILIGNGFDLAHGMKTSYKSFIDDYWSNIVELVKKTDYQRPFENDEIKITKSPAGFLQENTFEELSKQVNQNKSQLNFKNQFLKILTNRVNIQNWVDVENEYYITLKKIYRKDGNVRGYSIEDLNTDFKRIETLLIEYLDRVEKEFDGNRGKDFARIRHRVGKKIYEPIKYRDFSEDSINQRVDDEYKIIEGDYLKYKGNFQSEGAINSKYKNILWEIDDGDPKTEIRRLLLSENATRYFDLVPDNTLLLSFNYTFTEYYYGNPKDHRNPNIKKITSVNSNHLHGTITGTDSNDSPNPVIFGYGDELDEDYKALESINDNKYLENIKSIKYQESNKYKQLLRFINSGHFQIFIFGHSCGISDRTLLNTMFEHDNCASIKLFYHQKNEDPDNFSDVMINISRNFNDKAKMRDRVVNKNYSNPLT